DRTRSYAVEANVDSFVFRRINRLIRLNPGIAFPVAVGVQNKWSPTLSLGFVFGLHVNLRVEPAFDGAVGVIAAAREPENVVVVQIQMVRAETCIDRRDLFRLWIIQFDLPAALIDWKCLGRRMVGALTAERHRLILSN